MIYYKATTVEGLDFYSGTIDYAAAIGRSVRARSPRDGRYACCTSGVLHAARVPTETLVGGSWPCRLFEVEGRPVAQEGHKFGFRQLRVVREVDAHSALGPQGREVAALIERAGRLTTAEARQLAAARNAAARAAVRDAAGNAARHAARRAAWNAARASAWDAATYEARRAAWAAPWASAGNAAGDAAWAAAGALVARDLIGQSGFTQAHYDTLTGPWRSVIGPLPLEDAAS